VCPAYILQQMGYI